MHACTYMLVDTFMHILVHTPKRKHTCTREHYKLFSECIHLHTYGYFIKLKMASRIYKYLASCFKFLAVTKQQLEVQGCSSSATVHLQRYLVCKNEMKLVRVASVMIGYCIVTWIPLATYIIITTTCNCRFNKYVRYAITKS